MSKWVMLFRGYELQYWQRKLTEDVPEHMTITKNYLSPYQKKIADKLDIKLTSTNKKLCATLNNKRRYVVYYKNLLFYMEKGMLLRNVHRVIMFKQAKFLKSYVDFNTKMRKNAKANKNDLRSISSN